MKSLKSFLAQINASRYYPLGLLFLIALAVILRIYALPILGFHGDFQIFNLWGDQLDQAGFTQFYELSRSNYLPIYVYILKFSNLIQPLIHGLNQSWSTDQVNWISYKFPCLIFDLGTAYFIYLLIRRKTQNVALALWGVIFYLYNPVLFHNTYIYGQNNVLLYLPTIALLYTLDLKKYIWAGIAFAAMLLIKPTGIIIAPIVILFLILAIKKDYKSYLKFVLSAYFTIQILILPFFFRLPTDYLKFFFDSLTSGNGYKVTQMYSYNLWYLLTGSGAVSDATLFHGRSYNFWGQVMFALSYLISFVLMYLARAKNYLIILTVIYFCFFIFPTRVHEGYLLFAFPIFILTIFIYRSYILGLIYLLSLLAYSYNIWGYWPWKLITYLPLYYGGRFANTAALLIVLTPLALVCYFVYVRMVKNQKTPNEII